MISMKNTLRFPCERLVTIFAIGTFIAALVLCVPASAKEVTAEEVQGLISNAMATCNEPLASSRSGSGTVDAIVAEIAAVLSFAEAAMAKGNTAVALDAFALGKGLVNVAIGQLPEQVISNVGNLQNTVPEERLSWTRAGLVLTNRDMRNIKAVIGNMTAIEKSYMPDTNAIIARLEAAGFNSGRIKAALAPHGTSLEAVVAAIGTDLENLETVNLSLNGGASGRFMAGVTQQLALGLSNVGKELQTALASIATTIGSVLTSELDELARELGFSSFAAAVNAFNDYYGTDYTVDQARDALGY
jgi:hypothetical protein